ncbi:MAG: hypothetical protein IPI34_00990 [bacterium]|nr:hypothetical protein [bacterium]
MRIRTVPAVLCLLCALSLLAVAPAAADPPPVEPYGNFPYLALPPSASGGAAGAFANPAAWAAADRASAAFWWTDPVGRGDRFDDWGFSWGRRLGFAAQRRSLDGTPAAHSAPRTGSSASPAATGATTPRWPTAGAPATTCCAARSRWCSDTSCAPGAASPWA